MINLPPAPAEGGIPPLIVVSDSIPFHTAIVAPLRAAWRWILATVVMFAGLSLLQQALARPVYSASAVVAASTPPSGNKSGNLGRIAAIAGVDLGSKQVTSFDQFLFIVHSLELSSYQIGVRPMLRLVFADDWDPALREWKRPAGFGASLRSAILPMFHLPVWSPPDAMSLADHYDLVLDERKLADSGLVRLVYADTDPRRAAVVLSLIIADGNERLRREAAASARLQAQYLRERIAQTEVREYRNTLIDLLADEEQTLLLSNGAIPYAAKTIEAVNVSPVPTSQRPLIYALIASVLGFSIAAFVAIVSYNRRLFRGRRVIAVPGDTVAPVL
jgi:hypothetical protein